MKGSVFAVQQRSVAQCPPKRGKKNANAMQRKKKTNAM
jgi:hypothetical protein